MGIKYNLDRLVAAYFGRFWSFFNYLEPSTSHGIDSLPREQWPFYLTLTALALPFVWIGVVLTLRRLRSICWPSWCVLLFFVPLINLFFFLTLCVVPSQHPHARIEYSGPFANLLSRIIPRSGVGSAIMGVLIPLFVALGLTLFSVWSLRQYGWGLFVGLPFAVGLLSVVIYGYHQPRSFVDCMTMAMASIATAGFALLILAVEGAICIIMAAPLALLLALAGAIIGYVIQRRPAGTVQTSPLLVIILALPASMTVQRTEPDVFRVDTAIRINATPEHVWHHVVSFSRLEPPEELIFKLGIAYPTEARIDGSGVGATRHCIFSTGEFVEPIEVWLPPRLLRFSVCAQPAPLVELSPYSGLNTPHLDNFLRSKRGQFRLERLDDGGTQLIGTTWYEHRIWPAAYWRIWSDAIIHAIHRRVLRHICTLAETQ